MIYFQIFTTFRYKSLKNSDKKAPLFTPFCLHQIFVELERYTIFNVSSRGMDAPCGFMSADDGRYQRSREFGVKKRHFLHQMHQMK